MATGGWGYNVERSEDGATTWTTVTGGSGMVTDGGTTKSVTITQHGYYRAQAQGTDAGTAVSASLSSAIVTIAPAARNVALDDVVDFEGNIEGNVEY